MKKDERWEPFTNMRVSCEPLLVRLDGTSFGNTVEQLGAHRPFDERVMRALVNATMRLHLQGLVPRAAFIVSDEVTLGFSRSIPYGGRVEKILSVLSSRFSSLVGANFREMFNRDVVVAFDARILVVPDTEFFFYLRGRQRTNRNNCIVSYCATVLQSEEPQRGKKQNKLHKLDQAQMIEILLANEIDVAPFPRGKPTGLCVTETKTHW